MTFNYDVIVVGAGHAGCEAAAAARQYGFEDASHYNGHEQDCADELQSGCRRISPKDRLIREIDALGGYMGIVTDRTAIQFRMLNQSKGPAMWSRAPRATAPVSSNAGGEYWKTCRTCISGRIPYANCCSTGIPYAA